uniref:Uncharacterized protein n=1 Tax=Rhynchosporium graminicola TaxID=2792576 RepID=V5W677_9HELO|nr:hypothetical protein [Rhynchosporium commune]AHC02370.1 hypothetical protein [Rhynchosporium commune]
MNIPSLLNPVETPSGINPESLRSGPKGNPSGDPKGDPSGGPRPLFRGQVSLKVILLTKLESQLEASRMVNNNLDQYHVYSKRRSLGTRLYTGTELNNYLIRNVSHLEHAFIKDNPQVVIIRAERNWILRPTTATLDRIQATFPDN